MSFQPEMSRFCHSCTGRTTFQRVSAKCTSLYKTAFPARRQHVLSFSHRAQHFLPVLSKVCQFLQNSVFRPSSEPFVIFALGTTVLSCFQQSAKVCTKQYFQPEISTFCHFCTECTTSQPFLAKCTSLSKKAFSTPEISKSCHFSTACTTLHKFPAKCTVCTEQCFSPFCQLCTGRTSSYPFLAKCTSLCKTAFPSRGTPRLDILTLDVPRFSNFGKVHEFVQDSLLIWRSARFVIFALGKLLFSHFQQVHEFGKNIVFSPR